MSLGKFSLICSALAGVVCAGSFDQQQWSVMIDRGRAAAQSGRLADAEQAYRQAIQAAEEADDWNRTANGLTALGMLLREHGRLADAGPLFTRALDLYVQHEDRPSVMRALNNLAALNQSSGRLADAEKLYRQALSLAANGQYSPDVVMIASANLAVILSGRGRFEEAVKMLEAVIDRDGDASSGDGSAAVASQLGILYRRLGRLAEAENALKRVLVQRQKNDGATAMTTANALNNLGDLLMAQGKHSEAEAVLAQSVQICGSQPVGQFRCAGALNNLASAELSIGRTLEAEQHLLRAIEVSAGRPEARAPHAAALNNLARIYSSQKRTREALSLFTRALETWQAAAMTDHPDYAATLSNLGTLNLEQKKYDAAGAAMASALEVDERILGPFSDKVAVDLGNLAAVALAQKRYGETEALLRRALAIRERASSESEHTANLLAGLGHSLARQKRFVEAAESYGRAFAIWEKQRQSPRLNDLALLSSYEAVLREAREYARAEEISARAMRIRVKAAIGQSLR